MELKEINQFLKNLPDLRRSKFFKEKITINGPEDIGGEFPQGETGEYHEIYRFPCDEELYVRLTITTDSYDDNETISGVEFVRPTAKEITVYESI